MERKDGFGEGEKKGGREGGMEDVGCPRQGELVVVWGSPSVSFGCRVCKFIFRLAKVSCMNS